MNETIEYTSWPTQVRCEMNITQWVDHLSRYDLTEKYGYLMDGFVNGFHQGIPEHKLDGIRWFCPPNHKSASLAREKIEANFLKEKNAGRLLGPYAQEEIFKHWGFFRSSPLGAIENGDGSFRPICDLSFPRDVPSTPSVNSFVDKNEFITTWDDFKVVALFLRNLKCDVLLGIFDWESAYRQIPTHPSQWKYLTISDFDGGVYVDTRIAFGGVAGCGSFGGPADGWKAIMERKFELLKVFRWVDDNLMIKLRSHTTSMLDIVKASELLGVKTNSTKYSEFADEQKFIGFLWNAKEKTVRLPAVKLLQRRQEIDQFWTKLSWKKNELERINGKLNHLSLILPQLKAYLAANFRWLASWKTQPSRKAPTEVLLDMAFWRDCLTDLAPSRLIPDPIERCVGWVGDASSEYGIGVVIGKRWAQFRWLDGWKDPDNLPKRTIAWAETVAVRLGLLMMKKLMIMKGNTFSCLSDNTTTNGAVKNKRSRDYWVNEEWKTIQRTLLLWDTNIVTHYVKSADNEADRLSRGFDPSKKSFDCLVIDVPLDLKALLFQVVPDSL